MVEVGWFKLFVCLNLEAFLKVVSGFVFASAMLQPHEFFGHRVTVSILEADHTVDQNGMVITSAA